VGPFVLELHRRTRDDVRPGAIGGAGAAWRALGASGRTLVVGLLVVDTLVAVWWLPATARVVGTWAAIAVLVVGALVDVVEHRLPNAIVALAAVPVAATLAVSWEPDVARSVATGALLMAVPLLLTHLASPSGMGFGDVKAGLVLGAAIGLVDGQLALVALVLGLGSGALWGLARRARAIPLGPALVLGALGALAVGRALATTSSPRGLLVAEIQAVVTG
jgi:leader peptidase (prepilin peptidase)/N-methyltransferase